MRTEPPQMTCPACDGHGHVPIPRALQDVLEKLDPPGITNAELSRALDLSPATSYQRAQRLCALGLAERHAGTDADSGPVYVRKSAT